MIFALSSVWMRWATSSITWPAANASAEVGSIVDDEPPYAFTYAFTNAALPGDFSCGNQSPVLKIPLTFFAPTLLANSAGSFGPFVRNTNFGLNFCWIIALTWAYASPFWVPPMIASGCFDAAFWITGPMSVVSEG